MDIVTEFIILTLKPNTPLEDPATEAGKVFLKAIYDIKSVHGYRSASWGRSLEDENVVVWAIGMSCLTGSPHGQNHDDFVKFTITYYRLEAHPQPLSLHLLIKI